MSPWLLAIGLALVELTATPVAALSDFDEDTEVASRDVDYKAQVAPLSISAGQIEETTTITIISLIREIKNVQKTDRLTELISPFDLSGIELCRLVRRRT